jgi:hypothetical protein
MIFSASVAVGQLVQFPSTSEHHLHTTSKADYILRFDVYEVDVRRYIEDCLPSVWYLKINKLWKSEQFYTSGTNEPLIFYASQMMRTLSILSSKAIGKVFHRSESFLLTPRLLLWETIMLAEFLKLLIRLIRGWHETLTDHSICLEQTVTSSKECFGESFSVLFSVRAAPKQGMIHISPSMEKRRWAQWAWSKKVVNGWDEDGNLE